MGQGLLLDEYKAYNAVDRYIRREIITHSKQYAEGDVHTNTIEGFWSLVKRAWYGQHHKHSKQFLPLYIAESCYKYNNRETENVVEKLIRESLT